MPAFAWARRANLEAEEPIGKFLQAYGRFVVV
jgi:hypothetical protein